MEAWKTRDELEYLYDLALRGRIRALIGWLSAAKTYERDWGRITSALAIRYAEASLRAALADQETVRKSLPLPGKWLEGQAP